MADVESMKAPNWPYVSLMCIKVTSYMGWAEHRSKQGGGRMTCCRPATKKHSKLRVDRDANGCYTQICFALFVGFYMATKGARRNGVRSQAPLYKFSPFES